MDPIDEWRERLGPLAESARMTPAFRTRLRRALEADLRPRRPAPRPLWVAPAAAFAVLAAALLLPAGLLPGETPPETPKAAVSGVPAPSLHQRAMRVPPVPQNGTVFRPAAPALSSAPATSRFVRHRAFAEYARMAALRFGFDGKIYRVVGPRPVRPGGRIGEADGLSVDRLPGISPLREIAVERRGYPALAARPVVTRARGG